MGLYTRRKISREALNEGQIACVQAQCYPRKVPLLHVFSLRDGQWADGSLGFFF